MKIYFDDIEAGHEVRAATWGDEEFYSVIRTEPGVIFLDSKIGGETPEDRKVSYYKQSGIVWEVKEETSSALDTQIGGNHYKTMPIQPMEYSMKNGLDACQHTIIKYVTRFREKGGIEDLEKAKHCIDLLIGFEREKENG